MKQKMKPTNIEWFMGLLMKTDKSSRNFLSGAIAILLGWTMFALGWFATSAIWRPEAYKAVITQVGQIHPITLLTGWDFWSMGLNSVVVLWITGIIGALLAIAGLALLLDGIKLLWRTFVVDLK